MAEDSKLRRRRDAGTFLALMALLLIAVGLLGLLAFVLQPLLVLGMVALVVGSIVYGWLQYIVWGRWLARRLADEQLAEGEQ